MPRLKSSLLLAFLCSLGVSINEAKCEQRKLTFPKDGPMGQLSLFTADGAKLRPSISVAAVGTVTINVPPDVLLGIDLNPRCIEHPEKLAALPTTGIDQISMTYMSMEDGKSQCDKALAAIPAIKHPLRLICTRTDATDDGILSFKSLPMLEHLDCFMSGVDGRFLKETKRLQNLTVLSLSNNGIKSEYVKNVAQLPKLEYLDLSLTDLTNEAMPAIGQLKHLKGLFISSDPKVTDDGIKSIQNCKTLERLDLSFGKNFTDKCVPFIHNFSHLILLKVDATRITAQALMQLKDLPLISLTVPQSYWKLDVDKLRKAFKPGVIKAGTREITKEIEVELAPLK